VAKEYGMLTDKNAAKRGFARLGDLRGWAKEMGVTVYFSALTILMTWPLAAHMSTDLVGQIGDNIYFVWMIGWMKKALFDLHVNPFNVWFLNYPEGWNMAYTEITPAQLALALPFSFLGGPTFAYNMAMLLTFVLSGLGMYFWIRRMTGRRGPALVAGTIFAFLPYRFAHFLIGHLNLSGTQWLPFYFMGLFELFDAGRPPRWRSAVLAGVMLGLIGLTSQYYLYMTILVTAFLLFIYLVFLQRRRWKDVRFWKFLALLGIVALPLIAVAVAPYVTLSQQGGLPDRTMSIVRKYSASPTDFFLPSTDHFLWGSWIGSHFNREMWVEGTLYIGVVSVVLGVVAWIKRKQAGRSGLMVLLLCGALFAMVLAMGTDLHWNGSPVEITTPAFLAGWIHRPTIPLLLPGYFLFQYFPLYAKLRALMRFGLFVLVFTSAAAGLGCAWLVARIKPHWRSVLVAGLLLLVFVDFYPGPYTEFAPVQPRPVDAWLALQPDKGAVIQFPFIKGEDQDQTYYTLIHGKPFVGGFFNAFPPPQYARIRPLMENFPDQQSVDLIHQLGAFYVLVDRASYPDIERTRQQCEQLGLKFVTEIGGQLVFVPEK
jgi:hypothetical protein